MAKNRVGINKKLVERYYAAWNTLNSDNPASFYAEDTDLVFFDIVPLKYKGWTEYKKGVQKTFFDLKITRRGDVAWMTLTFHLSFTLKTGKAMKIDCRHSAVWAKRRDKWLIVHEHISAPLPI
jgi:ketosteroid isomerase-like protein